ncbi:MAG: CsbD family protein [Burkholderiales bacterium]|nr:CsbD family protein [Burkholderiales bacterium]
MNQDRFAGIWKQVRGKVKGRWGELTHDPRAVIAGTRDQLAGRIQEGYGISKDVAERQLKEFLHRNRNWDLSHH